MSNFHHPAPSCFRRLRCAVSTGFERAERNWLSVYLPALQVIQMYQGFYKPQLGECRSKFEAQSFGKALLSIWDENLLIDRLSIAEKGKRFVG